MKSNKYLLISLLALSIAIPADACIEPFYKPEGYYMYRVCDPKSPDAKIDNVNPSATANCVEWQRLTSTQIPAEDIYRVVYSMTLEEYEAIYENRDIVYENEFVEWITKKDIAILDFLLLAKTNEEVRFRRHSRWYYPTMKIGARMTLEEIAEKALSATDVRLRDRYLLQAVRALFSLSRYDECVELWEKEVLPLPNDNLMKKLIKDYIAGAMFHAGRESKESLEYFAQQGDVQSLLHCMRNDRTPMSRIDKLAVVCEYAPNSQFIPHELYRIVHDIERHKEDYVDYNYDYSAALSEVLELSMKMVKDKRVENKALWYYTASFAADFMGKESLASQLLREAEKCKSTPIIDESIRVFRIYLDAKLMTYNSNYEKRLHEQLKWLCSKIANNIDEDVRNEVVSGYKMKNCRSFYYWNDMLRRILLAEVCPRMIEAGKSVRALQLANMADNYLYNVVDQIEVDLYDSLSNSWYLELCTMKQYRYTPRKHNILDYSNHFFVMIDSLGIDVTKAYVDNVTHSTHSFDCFLNARGYTGSDYLNDILGTHYLRCMRYEEAMKYLSKVSTKYKNHSNVRLTYDPFAADPPKAPLRESDFKYDFAREMYSLEQNIEIIDEPNRKAQLMIKYALGLRNSFDWCWSITHYYKDTPFWHNVYEMQEWEHDALTRAARQKANEMIDEALRMITDDEVAASIQYQLKNFATVVCRYPNTEYARLVRGACDNLKDYHAETYSSRKKK